MTVGVGKRVLDYCVHYEQVCRIIGHAKFWIAAVKSSNEDTAAAIAGTSAHVKRLQQRLQQLDRDARATGDSVPE